jgi:hypothetical protein
MISSTAPKLSTHSFLFGSTGRFSIYARRAAVLAKMGRSRLRGSIRAAYDCDGSVRSLFEKPMRINDGFC